MALYCLCRRQYKQAQKRHELLQCCQSDARCLTPASIPHREAPATRPAAGAPGGAARRSRLRPGLSRRAHCRQRTCRRPWLCRRQQRTMRCDAPRAMCMLVAQAAAGEACIPCADQQWQIIHHQQPHCVKPNSYQLSLGCKACMQCTGCAVFVMLAASAQCAARLLGCRSGDIS